jgi:ribosomal protein L14E/L6E/L27E
LELNAGDIVCSKAGRDKGKYFVVIKAEDSEFVYICDGKLRKVDKPKKKKIKHLAKTSYASKLIKDKLEASERVTNPELRRVIGEIDNNANV